QTTAYRGNSGRMGTGKKLGDAVAGSRLEEEWRPSRLVQCLALPEGRPPAGLSAGGHPQASDTKTANIARAALPHPAAGPARRKRQMDRSGIADPGGILHWIAAAS